jgi:polyether ionophore transport system permease protein
MTSTSAITLRTLKGSRVRDGSFAVLFALVSYANAAGYRAAYPTTRDRLAFAHSFAGNPMLRLFYGLPHNLLTLGGYSAWRIGGFFAIGAAAWGTLAAVGALRGEEETGRSELVLTGPAPRLRVFSAALLAVALGAIMLALATLLGLLAAGLPLAGSCYLALSVLAPALVFAGVGALASQLASTRRIALELGAGVVAVALALRAIADTAAGLGWLRWSTPLGWSEQLRAFTGPQPMVLVLFVCALAVLLTVAAHIGSRRDIGRGRLQSNDSHEPRLALLSSPTALALRQERTSFGVWVLATGVYGVIAGVLCTSPSERNIPSGLAHELRRLGVGTISNPADVLGLYFLFFLLIVCAFACAQVTAARREESERRLQTLLAEPYSRGQWLAGRLALATAGAVTIALTAGVTAWAGAAIQDAGIPLSRMLEAGANCLPLALMFLGVGFLALAVLPRASSALTYGLLTLAFVWELFGSLLAAPGWLVRLTPFQHVGLVPAQAIQLVAGAVMLAVAVFTALAARTLFQQRDLLES